MIIRLSSTVDLQCQHCNVVKTGTKETFSQLVFKVKSVWKGDVTCPSKVVQSSFPIIHKVDNIDI